MTQLLLVAACCFAAADAKPADAQSILGVWELAKLEGLPEGAPQPEIRLDFKNDGKVHAKMTTEVNGEEKVMEKIDSYTIEDGVMTVTHSESDKVEKINASIADGQLVLEPSEGKIKMILKRPTQ